MGKSRDLADLIASGSILADGTLSTTEIDGVTATSTELNLLDGITRGSILYGADGDSSARLSIGSSGTVLTSNGTDISWTTPAASGLQNVSEDTTPQLGGNLDLNGNDLVTTSNADIDLDPNGTGTVVFKGNSTKGAGQFKLNCEVNSHGITIKGPPHSAAASYTLTLPNDDGNADQVLSTNGSGVLSWADAGGGATDYQTFTSSGTWTKAADVNYVLVEIIGGGGGGGQNGSTSAISQGGGGGAGYLQLFRASDLGATETVTVGAGGSGQSGFGNADGGDGGNSSFGSHITANGGQGGYYAWEFGISSTNRRNKGHSGSGAYSIASPDQAGLSNPERHRFGESNYSGGGGGVGSYGDGGNAFIGGAGGGGLSGGTNGNGGTSVIGGNGGAAGGTAGSAPGGGGGAAYYATASGAGAAGRVRVWSW